MSLRAPECALVEVDRGGVVAALTRAIAEMEQRFRMIWVERKDLLP